jgi:small-conductance mechanosensitive channel
MDIPQGLQDAIQPEGVSGWDVLVAVVVMVAAFPVSRAVDHVARRAARRVPNLSSDTALVVGRTSRYLVLFGAATLALSLVGIDVGWAVAVVFLILVVLMLRPLVENSAAGLLLQARPSFAVGDEIEVLGYTGEVIEISARTTVLKTSDRRRVHTPNTQVLGGPIVVYTAFKSRRASVDGGVDPSADLDHVSRLLVAAVADVEGVQPDPAPEVMARSFGDGPVNLSVRFWFGPDTHSDVAVTDRVIRSLKKALATGGVDLPPPQLMIQTQASPANTEASSAAGESEDAGESDPPAS